MASSFRLPNHEQDEARIKLYDLAQPHEPTAYEKQSMMEVEEALATFKTEDKYHKLMLKKAETLPPIVQLVRACKMREDSLQAHHAEQVQHLLQEKEAELTTKHTTELKEAQDKYVYLLYRRFARTFTNLDKDIRNSSLKRPEHSNSAKRT